MAEQDVNTLKQDLQELESVRRALADFYCEDPATFKIEECFKIFYGFCTKLKQAVAENERRRIQEEQAVARRKQREEQLAAKKRTSQFIFTNFEYCYLRLLEFLFNLILFYSTS